MEEWTLVGNEVPPGNSSPKHRTPGDESDGVGSAEADLKIMEAEFTHKTGLAPNSADNVADDTPADGSSLVSQQQQSEIEWSEPTVDDSNGSERKAGQEIMHLLKNRIMQRCNAFKLHFTENTAHPSTSFRLSTKAMIALLSLLALETFTFNFWLLQNDNLNSPTPPATTNASNNTNLPSTTTCGQLTIGSQELEVASTMCAGPMFHARELDEGSHKLDANTHIVSQQQQPPSSIHTQVITPDVEEGAAFSAETLEARLQRLELESIRTQHRLAAQEAKLASVETAMAVLESRMTLVEEELFTSRQYSRTSSLKLGDAVSDVQQGMDALVGRVEGLELWTAIEKNMDNNNRVCTNAILGSVGKCGPNFVSSPGQDTTSFQRSPSFERRLKEVDQLGIEGMQSMQSALIDAMRAVIGDAKLSDAQKKAIKQLKKALKQGEITDGRFQELSGRVESLQREVKRVKKTIKYFNKD